jgi:hypothetical protein
VFLMVATLFQIAISFWCLAVDSAKQKNRHSFQMAVSSDHAYVRYCPVFWSRGHLIDRTRPFQKDPAVNQF